MALRVGGQEVPVLLGQLGQLAPVGGAQVAGHGVVVREGGRSRAQLGAHVADSTLAGGADAGGAGAEVLDDAVGAAGDGQVAGQVQDDVLGGSPAAQLAGEVDADELGVQDFPGQAGHDLHGVGAAHAHGDGAEAAAVWGCGSRCQSLTGPGRRSFPGPPGG